MITIKRLKFSFMALLFLFGLSFTANAVTVFQFDFEAGTTVSTDNAVGTPTFTQVGTVGVTTGACNGTGGRNSNGWDANDALRFTVNTTGYSALGFSYLERTSNTNVGTFLVRVSTDLTNWTTIRSSYTPTTTCASSGNLSIAASFDNQATVYIEIFKINTGTATTTFRIDDVTLTGTAAPVCPTITPTISQTSVLCFGGTTGTLTINSVSGGTAPYTYSRNNGGSYQSSNSFTGLPAGTYVVKVKDANNCESGGFPTAIGQPTPVAITSTSQSDVTVNGGNDGSITVTASGGTGTKTYSKDNGVTYQASNTFGSLTAGTYQVRVKDDNNCETAALPVTITEPASVLLAATFTATNITCNGADNGQIQFTVSGGITPYVLAITGPVNGTQNLASAGSYTFTGLPAGSYLCEVLDNNLDIVSDTKVITQPAAFSFTTSKTDVACFGVNTGTITVNGATGGTGALQYSIDNGTSYQVSNSFTGLTSGTYDVRIKDANNCESVAQSVTINSPASAVSFNTAKVDVSCFGGNTGSITVTGVTGGTSPYEYSKDNGATYGTNDIFSGLTAATYQIKVKDANGCETNATAITITQPASAVTFTRTVTNVSCFGANNGTITITAAGGSGAGYQYSNDNGTSYQAGNSFTGLSAGTYTLIVKDGNNCTSSTSTATITEPADFTVTNANTNIACNGGNNGAIDISVSGGVNCNNGSGLVISKVMVDPTGGDAAQEFVEVIATRDINFSTTPYTVIVSNNGAATANGWIAGNALTYAFEISTGTATAGGVYYVGGTNMAPATNRLRAIDITTTGGDGGIGALTSGGVIGNGGANADGVAIFDAPVASITSSTAPIDAVFFGTGIGTAVVSAGTAGYQLPVNDLYNGGKLQSTSFFTASPSTNNVLRAAGTFDALTGTFTTGRTFTNVAFVNGTSGITLNNFGPQYTYNWGGGITTQDRTNLTAGTYNLTVTNCNGCSKPSSYTITEPATLSANAVATEAICFGNANGSVDATVTGGTIPYTYSWSNGATTEDLTSLIAGAYTLTVTDANGCTATTSVTVNQPAAINIVIATVNDASCFGGGDGSITLFANGGNSMLDYLWSTSANTNNINGLSAGLYSVTISDNLGCSTTATYNVGQSAPIVVNTAATNVSCYNGTNGAINATVSGGTSPYTYNWSNGANTEDITNLTFGFYIVTVTDDYGCTATKQSLVDEPLELTITAGNGGPYQVGQTANFTATPAGGSLPYSYQWSEVVNGSLNSVFDKNPFILNAQVANSGTYTITVTDDNGCSATAATSLSVIPIVTSVTWNGSVSDDWHTPANWTPNVVPTPAINVTIPSGTSFNPTISTANAAAKNVTFTGTGLVFISVQQPYELSVKGNWTGNSNTVQLGAGAVVFDQPGATIGGVNFFSRAKVNANTSILSTATVTITGVLEISGGVLTTSNKLIIRSNIASTARIAPILSGSISGSVTQERYIPAGPVGYEYLASGVSGQTMNSLKDDIQTVFGTPASVQWYNEALPGNQTSFGWTSFASNGAIPAHRGLAAYMYARPKTVDFIGPAYQGNQNIPVIYTSSGSPVDDGFNLVANPYISPIDWDAPTGWTRTNIDPTIYILNPVTNNNVTYNHVTNIGTGGFNGRIANGQSFFVQTTGIAPVLAVTELVKTTSATFYKNNDEQVTNYFRVKVAGENGNGDEMLLGFTDNATAGFDRELDAAKISGGYVDMAMVTTKGEKLTQQFLSAETESAVIPVSFNTNGEAGKFTVTFENTENVTGDIYLRDNVTGTLTDVKAVNGYTFTVSNSNIGNNESRFDLVIGSAAANGNSDEFTATVYPNPATTKFNIALSKTEAEVVVNVYNLIGTLVYSNTATSTSKVEVNAELLQSGVYMVEVVAAGNKQVTRLVIDK
jgi:hypothetical protein